MSINSTIKSGLLAASLFVSASANAALVTESFSVTAIFGPFAGATGTGSFSYDDMSITGIGDEIITAADGLTLDFTVFGQMFTEADDVDAPDYPELSFFDGEVVSLDFLVIDPVDCGDCLNPVDILDPTVTNVGFFDLAPSSAGGFEGEMFVNTVPVPAAVWLFASGFLGLVGVARRR